MNHSYPRIGLAVMAISAIGLAFVALSSPSHSAAKSRQSGPETAQAATPNLKLEIATQCRAGEATFKIKNAGAAWPKSSTFEIYRLAKSRGHVIAKRRMRLSAGQQASFRIKASKNTTGRLGLSVDPSWFERRKGYDAKLECR